MKTSKDSLATLNYGEAKPMQNSPVRANQARVEDIPKKFTLYIPSNIEMENIVSENTPSFKYNIDCFKYILHLISSIPINNKDTDFEYVPINSKLLQRRIRSYRYYLDYLVFHNIILENKQYIPGKISRSFKVHPNFISEIKPTFIYKRTLIKSILNYIDIGNPKRNYLNEDPSEYTYLTKWLNKDLCIDFRGAKTYLAKIRETEILEIGLEKAWLKFNSRLITVYKIKRCQHSSKIDNTSGRLHTVLTQIKGDLRQFIYYKEKNLVSIDVVNSQPYLATVLLDPKAFLKNNLYNIISIYNNKFKENIPPSLLPYYGSKNLCKAKDELKFIDWVSSGLFYEKFGEEINSTQKININSLEKRKLAKAAAFNTLFSPNTSISYNKNIKNFKLIFPTVYKRFSIIKQGKGRHNTLACTLQHLESNLILKNIAKNFSIKYPNEAIFTIHDSIITTKENIKNAYSIMESVLEKATGIKPILKMEDWAA